MSEQKIQPVTDEEIEDFCFGMYDTEGRCMHCSEPAIHESSCPVVVWPRIKAGIAADREKIAALTADVKWHRSGRDECRKDRGKARIRERSTTAGPCRDQGPIGSLPSVARALK